MGFLIEVEALAPRAGSSELLLVDCRKPDAYAAGHIPGAINLSTYDCFVPDTTASGLAAFGRAMAARYAAAGGRRDQPIVVYESDTGMRAARELFILEWLGHPDARILHGGLGAWVAAGGAVGTRVPAARAGTLEPAPRPDMSIGADELAARAGTPGFVPLDTRDDLEWSGRDRTACCARRGRVPGAVHVEWTELLAGGRLESPDAILGLLRERGVSPTDELVPYCHRGARAANTYYALRHAGCPRVRLYLGSWHEWSARADLPLER